MLWFVVAVGSWCSGRPRSSATASSARVPVPPPRSWPTIRPPRSRVAAVPSTFPSAGRSQTAATPATPGDPVRSLHRRRIYTEEMPMVVAAVWGTELPHYLFCTRMFERIGFYSFNRPGGFHHILSIVLMHFILFFQSSWCISFLSSNHPGTKWLAQQGIEEILSP